MRVAVVRFPGSNCEQDALHSLRDDLGIGAEYVWHEETSLRGFDGVIIPGGFSYGDYLRCGAIAARAPIMDAVREFAARGGPVLGPCNGFQILCEAGMLPGALMPNASRKFVCMSVTLRAENRSSPFTEGCDRLIRLPIAHGEGRYVCDAEQLRRLEGEGRVSFRYVDGRGEATEEANLNGSTANIAGVQSERGNVVGLMPHPERATRALLGGTDGRLILEGFRVMAAAAR